MDAIRVLIVDDHVFFSEVMQRTLSAEPKLDVVGVSHDGETAVELARKAKPDVVLMDIELPGELDGIEAGRRIKEASPETGIVVLSAHDDRRYIMSLPLEESTGWSYLLKQSVPDTATVVRAIEGSARGMMVLDPAVVMGLRPKQDSAVSGLTPRQREVLELIAQGFNNAAIADRLVLTERSVETYIHAIYQQLNLSGEQDIHARVRATLSYLQDAERAS